jgi:hypothetical protein
MDAITENLMLWELLEAARIRIAALEQQYRVPFVVRQQRCRERCEAVHALLREYRLPTTGRGAWSAILARLATVRPDLVLTQTPPGPLDQVPLAWVQAHTITALNLRRSYFRWLRDTCADGRRKQNPEMTAV